MLDTSSSSEAEPIDDQITKPKIYFLKRKVHLL